jgi:hypothetical protein
MFPSHTGELEEAVATGKALMVTSWLLLHWQPLPLVTVTEILAEAPEPAVQVIWVVLFPAVMVPSVIDQL